MSYKQFGLVLMVDHACNLRCTYCYAGKKSDRTMPLEIGQTAIDRTIASIEPGGKLELGFSGGEPLMQAELVSKLIGYARRQTHLSELDLSLSITTNGTQTAPRAWSLMTLPDMHLAISHDGLPEMHDGHRQFADGQGSSDCVLDTMQRLLAVGKDFRVVMVVRPDNVRFLPEGIEFLYDMGVRKFEPSLDLWTRWTSEDIGHLATIIWRCASIWRDHHPEIGITWFDEKAAAMSCVPAGDTTRCGFGPGEIAVAPSGRFYPCERLIGDDDEGNSMRFPGNIYTGRDFLKIRSAPCRDSDACESCSIQSICNTTCRCSNYVRTGDVTKPDGLLCMLNQVCARETARVLEEVRSGLAHAV